jgi:hypothetical protein
VRDFQVRKKKKSTEGHMGIGNLGGFQADQSHKRKSMQNYARSAEGVPRTT